MTQVKDTIMIDTWTNCYNLSWKGLLYENKETGESAFVHPAKMSRALVFRIIEHALTEGWLQVGQTVLDPFGGIGSTALPCLMNGLNYIGVELESRFVALGQKNLELWQAKFSSMPKWTGQARLLQGDSRKLASVIESAGCVVSSPPYSPEALGHKRGKAGEEREATGQYKQGYTSGELTKEYYSDTPGNLGNLPSGDISAIISSPPFAGNSGGRGEASRNGIDAALFDRHSGGMKKGTGESEGNLDHLPMGSIGAVISSPPFGMAQTGGGIAAALQDRSDYPITLSKTPSSINQGYQSQGESEGQLANLKEGNIQAIISSPPFADSVGSDDPDKRGGLYRDPKRRNDVNLSGTYGDTEGQLGAMRDGGIAAVISSPPFESSLAGQEEFDRKRALQLDSSRYGRKSFNGTSDNYGQSPNQLGNESGETFWQAAAAIVSQCAMVLPSGGHCVWVVKDYVKKGRIVPFSEQWAQLCEACGFELVHIHRAMLVKNRGVNQVTMEGEDVSKETARKSFFRLLAERNGSPKIDWETVLCFRRK